MLTRKKDITEQRGEWKLEIGFIKGGEKWEKY